MVNTKKKLTKQVNEVNEMTKAAYARYKGVSKAMVTKWLNDGRLVLTEDGKRVLVNESDARIKQTANLNNWANEQHAAAARVEVDKAIEEKTFTDLKDEVNDDQLSLEGNNADTLFKNARALREKATALQAAAEHEKFIGSLVSKEAARKFYGGVLMSIADNVDTLAISLAPVVLSLDNIPDCSSEIKKAIHCVLNRVADDLDKQRI